MSQDLFDKLMRLAWDGGATDGEAMTAFLKAKALKLRDKSINDGPGGPTPVSDETQWNCSIAGITCLWAPRIVNAVSQAAECYGVILHIDFRPFDETPVVFTMWLFARGLAEPCQKFARYVEQYLSPGISRLVKDSSTHLSPDVEVPTITDVIFDEMREWNAANGG